MNFSSYRSKQKCPVETNNRDAWSKQPFPHGEFHSAGGPKPLILQPVDQAEEPGQRAICPFLGSPGFGLTHGMYVPAPALPLVTGLVMLAAVTATSIMDLFAETGAYLRGHFRLTSGLHSGEYLQCAKVLAVPEYAERLGRELATKLIPLIEGGRVDLTVAPAIGGIVIGQEVARALKVRSLFTERESDSNQMTLRRGFEVQPGERAIVIEDVITTGGSTKEVIRVLESRGATVLAAGSIIDRSGGKADLGVPRLALETLNPTVYDPQDCPLCRQGQPLVKPGSRRA